MCRFWKEKKQKPKSHITKEESQEFSNQFQVLGVASTALEAEVFKIEFNLHQLRTHTNQCRLGLLLGSLMRHFGLILGRSLSSMQNKLGLPCAPQY